MGECILQIDYKQALLTKIGAAGFTPHSLSLAMGKSKNHVTKRLQGQTRVDDVLEICDILGCDPGELLRRPTPEQPRSLAEVIQAKAVNFSSGLAEADAAPAISELTRAWASCDGRLSEFGNLSDYVEVFTRPQADSTRPEVAFKGRLSLASNILVFNSEGELQGLFDGCGDDIREKTLMAHQRTAERRHYESRRSMIVRLSDKQLFKFYYERLLMLGTDADGSEVIIHYSKMHHFAHLSLGQAGANKRRPFLSQYEGWRFD